MKVQQVYEAVDSFAPFALAEPWDHVGLLIGDKNAEVTGILFALDITGAVVDEAAEKGFNLVVTHHPAIFAPIPTVTAESVVYKAVRQGISVISAHTNWDKAPGGVNDVLADALTLRELEIMDSDECFCRVGNLRDALSPQDFAEVVANAVGIAPRYNPGGRTVRRVALCGGSGADMAFTPAAEAQQIDAFVTADVKHHQYIEAASRGITLYDGGHFATENLSMPTLLKKAQKLLPGLAMELAGCYSGEII